jgi:type I restriction enzyme M protein
MSNKPLSSMQFSSESHSSIEEKIFNVLNIIRGEVATDNYYVVNYLLYLKKEGVLDSLQGLEGRDVKKGLIDRFSALIDGLFVFKSGDKRYANALFFFQEALNSLSERTLDQVFKVFSTIDTLYLQLHFKEIFEDAFYRVSKFEGRTTSEFLQPKELTEFICALADLRPGVKVYNPFAGPASYGVYFDDSVQYLGQEKLLRTWSLGLLRLLALGKANHTDFRLGESVGEWNPYSEKYDLIIASPPFNMKVSMYDSRLDPSLTAETYFLQKAIGDLTPDGKAIVVVSAGFLFSNAKEQKALRRALIEHDLLDTVITFPGGLLPNTGISFSVLVVNKAKRQKGKVLFVDAEDSIKEVSKKDRRIDVENLLSLIAHRNGSSVGFIDNKEIGLNDFSFVINRYLFEESVSLQGTSMPLGSILSPIPMERAKEHGLGKFVRIRDLKNDRLDFQLDTHAIEVGEVPKSSYKLEKSVLLLATRWKEIKPTFFHYNGEPVFISTDLLALEINNELVDTAYLVNELHSDYVSEQLNRYRTGAVVPYISRQDLLQVKIELPTPEEQRAKVRGAREAIVKLQMIEAERNALAHGLNDLAYKNFASVKHSMGKPLLNLNSGVRNIEAALSKLTEDWRSIRLSESKELTLEDAFNSLRANLKLLSNLLKKNEHDLEMGEYQLSPIDVVNYLTQYVGGLQAADSGWYDIELYISKDIEELFRNKLYILGNEDLLTIALGSIVENAEKHAFTQTGKEYKLEFRLGVFWIKSFPSIKLEIANNGEPFPEKFDLEKLIRKHSSAGSTANTGIGGFHVYEIVKRHGGKFDLITDLEITQSFTTIYEIQIPVWATSGTNG